MSGWQKTFQDICDEMKRNSETERTLPNQGKIVWCPKIECPNCHSIGTFLGDELDYGEFYKCALARYCPSCQKIYAVTEGRNFAPYAQERFLPIMKRRLIESPAFRKLITITDPCPCCNETMYTFHKDLGGIDYYDNYWTVCINPDCNWPGKHREHIESGPY